MAKLMQNLTVENGQENVERIPLKSIILDNAVRGASGDWNTEEIKNLALNIKHFGLLQNPLGYYEGKKVKLVDGHGRYYAVKHLGWSDMPIAILDNGISEDERRIAGLTANVMRKQMSRSQIAKTITSLTIKGDRLDKIAEYLGIGKSTAKLYDQIVKKLSPVFGKDLDIVMELLPMNTLRSLAQSPKTAEKVKVELGRNKVIAKAKKEKLSGKDTSRKAGKKAEKTVAKVAGNIAKSSVKSDKPIEPSEQSKARLYDVIIKQIRVDYLTMEKSIQSGKPKPSENQALQFKIAYILNLAEKVGLKLRDDGKKTAKK